MSETKIEWADKTWNPIIGCSHVSAGCENCYAERMASRLAHMAFTEIQRGGRPKRKRHYIPIVHHQTRKWSRITTFIPEALDDPLHWKNPQRVFVGSMTDLFHETTTDLMRDRVFSVMRRCPQHTFMILTKRPRKMAQYLPGFTEGAQLVGAPWPFPNVWLGVTAEDQAAADERIPDLLACPASVRFVSIEPMLGAVDLTPFLEWGSAGPPWLTRQSRREEDRATTSGGWVIVGGETGPGAREMSLEEARAVRDQCQAAGVPFFFKKVGDAYAYTMNKPRDWVPDDLSIRQFPEPPEAFTTKGTKDTK